jgi:sulfur-oxidizing protein SoxY
MRQQRSHHTTARIDRRQVVLGAGAAAAGLVLGPCASAAFDDDGDPVAAIKHIANGRPIKPGRVKLGLPELAENGNVVSMTVEVDSPMTAADHVKIIHIIAEKNPLAILARYHLRPQSGRARVATNLRLATTQTVNALAEMSDGSIWSGTATVLVTLSACLDGG